MATLRKSSRVSAQAQLAPRCRLQRPSKTAVCAPEPVTDGFLRYCFEPVVDDGEELRDQTILEREFFRSLSLFSQAYSLGYDVVTMENTSVYPHNVCLAFCQAEQSLQTVDPNASLAIIEDDSHRATLVVYKAFETGYCSFYIPLKSVYQALKERVRPSAIALLCSLIAYLHQIAGIAFYSDERSYIYYQCDMMAESMREDEDEKHLADFNELLLDTLLNGPVLERYVQGRGHLGAFEKRHTAFLPSDEWEESLHQISASFFRLYTQYPTRAYHSSFEPGLTHPDDDYSITPDQRVSFVWEWGDWVYDNLLDSLDCDFNGGGYVEEPLAYRLFDQPSPAPTLCLDFDETFFTALDDLAELLKTFAREQHNRTIPQSLPAHAGPVDLPTDEQ